MRNTCELFKLAASNFKIAESHFKNTEDTLHALEKQLEDCLARMTELNHVKDNPLLESQALHPVSR